MVDRKGKEQKREPCSMQGGGGEGGAQRAVSGDGRGQHFPRVAGWSSTVED